MKVKVKKMMSESNRSNFLDIIKGLMIIFIIITHFKFEYPSDYLKYGFVFYIDMAVPVFMIITGYLTALSLQTKNISTYSEAVSAEIVIPKLLRFLVPFVIAFTIEIPVLAIVKNDSFFSIFETFFRGGEGPGSYYTPVLIQLIFVAPVIYFIVKKYDFYGTVLCFIFTAFWEIVQCSWMVTDRPYAIIAFRYISIVAFGCYMAVGKVSLNKTALLSMFVIGVIWQTALNYIPLNPPLMNLSWARVNYLPSLLVVPVMYVLIKKFYGRCVSIPILQELGKASYNVFLTQMVFYGCGGAAVTYMFVPGVFLQLLVCIVVCTVTGYIFYRIEKILTANIIDFVKKHNYYRDKFILIHNFCNRFFGSK